MPDETRRRVGRAVGRSAVSGAGRDARRGDVPLHEHGRRGVRPRAPRPRRRRVGVLGARLQVRARSSGGRSPRSRARPPTDFRTSRVHHARDDDVVPIRAAAVSRCSASPLAAGCDNGSPIRSRRRRRPTPAATRPAIVDPSPSTSCATARSLRFGGRSSSTARRSREPTLVEAGVLEGPTEAERAQGLETASPSGTDVRDVSLEDAGGDRRPATGVRRRWRQRVDARPLPRSCDAGPDRLHDQSGSPFRITAAPSSSVGGKESVDPPVGRRRLRGPDATDPHRVAAARRHGAEPDPAPGHGERLRGDRLDRRARTRTATFSSEPSRPRRRAPGPAARSTPSSRFPTTRAR